MLFLMRLYKQIKKHHSLAIGRPFLFCIAAGVSLGGCLDWFFEKDDPDRSSSSPLSTSSSQPPIPTTTHNNKGKDNITLSSATVLQSVCNNEMKFKIIAQKKNRLEDSVKKTVAEDDLPDVIKDIVIDYLGGDFGDSHDRKIIFPSAYFFARCAFFCITKNGRRYNRVEAIILLQYVVNGNEEKAKAMLDNNPELVLCSETVIDYSRRIHKQRYPFQLALGAEDIEMARMIRPYFILAFNGDEKKAQDEIKKQYDAQFPSESKIKEKKEAAADLAALSQVTLAFHMATKEECQFLLVDKKESKEGEEKGIAAALQKFRTYLDSKTEEIITIGKHFNARLLIEAFNQYNTNYATFGNWDNPKNNLFWRQVIGYIQRYLPACYAQAFCQGIYYIVHGDEQLSRSMRFRFSPDYLFFPLDQGSFRLGYDYAGHGRAEGAWMAAEVLPSWNSVFSAYAQQKQQDSELMRRLSEPRPAMSTCSLM